ncbi:MAG: hypothetical protein ACWGN1_04945 [Desulfobulbales bacterium]
MKRFAITTIFIMAALGFIITACSGQKPAEKTPQKTGKVENLATTPQDIKKEAEDLAKTTMAYTKEQKALYQEKLQQKMAEYSQEMTEMQTKLSKLNALAQAKTAAEMEELSRKKAAMADKIKELQTAGQETYAKLKKDMDRAVEELDQAYGRVMEQFKK